MTGIPSWLMMVIYTWIHLYLIQSGTTGYVNQWIVKTFVTWTCTMQITQVPYLGSTLLIPLLFGTVSFAVSWIHDAYRELKFRPERKRYGVDTGRKFTETHWRFFTKVFVFTACYIAVGLLGASGLTSHYPESFGNVFCKIDQTEELGCVVDMQYYTPSNAETVMQECSNKSKYAAWDFCGTLCIDEDLVTAN